MKIHNGINEMLDGLDYPDQRNSYRDWKDPNVVNSIPKATLEDLRSGAVTWTPSGRSMTVEDEKKIRGFQMKLSKLIFEVRDHPIEISNYFVFAGG